MARENQGLQITLVIFVMLAIVLGVTTYLFGKRYYEALDAAASAKEREAAAAKNTDDAKADCDKLKRCIVGPKIVSVAEVEKQFDDDVAPFKGQFREDTCYYVPLLARLGEQVRDRNKTIETLKKENQALLTRFETREAQKDKQIKEYMAQVEKSGKDVEKAASDYTGYREGYDEERKKIASQMDKVRKESQGIVAKAEDKFKKSQEQLIDAIRRGKELAGKIEASRKETMDVPAGEITWVNQRNNTVWINLGRADALDRQTTFSVYSGDATDLGKAVRKASIEVTRVAGEHLAEARIVEDKMTDPILAGDKIYSPIWAPGQQTHFALVGIMNIDGDGRNALQTVRSLITMNGGVVDAEMDEKGNKVGKITSQTRYLILGDEPKSTAYRVWTEMITDAEELGIRKMPLAELKQKMGYKRQTSVERSGSAGAGDARPALKPADGVPKKSTSDVSDAVKKPRPQPKAEPKEDFGF